jgi:hypothetical protein
VIKRLVPLADDVPGAGVDYTVGIPQVVHMMPVLSVGDVVRSGLDLDAAVAAGGADEFLIDS